MGCRVDALDRVATVERIAALAQLPSPSLVVTLGVEMVMAAQHDDALRSIINSADLSVCDTIGILLASRLRGGPLRERVTGIDLLADIAARSATQRHVRVYLLGAGGETAVRAARMLEQRYPGAQICGARDGYFREAESAAVAAVIAASKASVLCAGLGSPKQELWLARHLVATGCSVGIGVGGSFDVLAGNVMRAPRAVQRAGLEWAYRLAREPRRWRRQLALPRFMYAVMRETLARQER